MTLDPQAQVILDAMAELDMGFDTSMSPTEMRTLFEQGTVEREIPDIGSTEDRNIVGPGGEIPIRIYRPTELVADPAPVVVFFHGGGWVIGGFGSHDITAREMANRTGMVWVAVEYRLAPEHPFPAAVDDALAATRWVAEHADELSVDAERLAVAGDSAGGNLAAVTTLRARDEGGPAIAFQALVYPCADMNPEAWPSMDENAEGYLLTRAAMDWFYGHYLGDQAEDARTNPLAAPLQADDHSGLPPAIVVTAGFDPLRDEGEAYAAKLAEAGVPVVAEQYEGMFHGFFGFTDLLDAARDAQAQVAAAIRNALTT